MAETFPFHYSHPYVSCQQCGGLSCFGRHCLSPGCEYIERAAFNRFERPPVPLPTTSCITPPPPTCNTVSSLMYAPGEYVAPQPIQLVNQCTPPQKGDEFQVSRVSYRRL